MATVVRNFKELLKFKGQLVEISLDKGISWMKVRFVSFTQRKPSKKRHISQIQYLGYGINDDLRKPGEITEENFENPDFDVHVQFQLQRVHI